MGDPKAEIQPATMTRDNLYWLSHDQVALFKTFRGSASRCKQTINHAIPRIKQLSSLLYDILLHCKNRSRIYQKIWLSVSIPKYPQYWMDSRSNSSATERKREKVGRNCVGRFYGGRKRKASIIVLVLVAS
ncbi:hypothetical protein Lal_00027470 [Lupinus albus]|nr:hypothetical protein Lal_00027470 [Lupinus albus]